MAPSSKDDKAPPAAPAATHAWRGGLCNCCGECSEFDLLSCLATTVGCGTCVWGVSQRRFLGGGKGTAIKWTAIMASLVLVPWIINSLVSWISAIIFGTKLAALSGASDDVNAQVEQLADDSRVIDIFSWVFAGLMVIGALAGVVIGARRRSKVRAALNLPGSCFGDGCRWFWCTPCTICQEARTLRHYPMHEGVVGAEGEGVWGGAAGGGSSGLAAAPAGEAMSKV